jgi:hypothetical protein
MPLDLNNPGFGLNYDQGFGSGAPPTGGFRTAQSDATIPLEYANQANRLKIAETEIQPAMLAQQNKQSRFNTVFPWLQGQMSGLLGGQGPYRVGGTALGNQPNIKATGIWTPSQIQQQVNSQNAASDAATGTQIKNMQDSLAGRGFGGNSPLAMALSGMAQNANLANKTQNEQQTRWNAAQGNAQQTLAQQQAQEQQYVDINQQDVARRQMALQPLTALLGAISGIV